MRFPLFALALALPALALLLFFGLRFYGNVVDKREAARALPPAFIDQIEAEASRDGHQTALIHGRLYVTTEENAVSAARHYAQARPGVRLTTPTHWEGRLTRPGDPGVVIFQHRRQGFTDPGLHVPGTPFDPGQTRIALILDDVGFNDEALVASAAAIGVTISFAVLPNAPRSSEDARFLDRQGFEILCHLPMEPDDSRNSPGPGAIVRTMNASEIRAATMADLRGVPAARGVNNHMGSSITSSRQIMRTLLSVLPKGMYYIDSRTTRHTVGEKMARALSIPTASRDIFLDDVRTEAAVKGQLASLMALATRKGDVIGIGHMYPETIAVLTRELPQWRQKGFRFVRAHEVVH